MSVVAAELSDNNANVLCITVWSRGDNNRKCNYIMRRTRNVAMASVRRETGISLRKTPGRKCTRIISAPEVSEHFSTYA